MVSTIRHSGKDKNRARLVVAGNWGGGRAKRMFRTVKLLCMILYWETYAITSLLQPMECESITARVNSNINYGL
jgi:hypothetical protein